MWADLGVLKVSSSSVSTVSFRSLIAQGVRRVARVALVSRQLAVNVGRRFLKPLNLTYIILDNRICKNYPFSILGRVQYPIVQKLGVQLGAHMHFLARLHTGTTMPLRHVHHFASHRPSASITQRNPLSVYSHRSTLQEQTIQKPIWSCRATHLGHADEAMPTDKDRCRCGLYDHVRTVWSSAPDHTADLTSRGTLKTRYVL
jgi:hypothetical protein